MTFNELERKITQCLEESNLNDEEYTIVHAAILRYLKEFRETIIGISKNE